MEMNCKTRMQRLCALAQLVCDHDMARLNRLNAACNHTRETVARLRADQPPSPDAAMFAVQQAHMRWVTMQQMRLNITLAGQRAAVLEQRARTARSFGRAQVAQRLIERNRKSP